MFATARARPPKPRRLGVEPLEARDVPAWATSPLATFAGDVAAPHQPDWVQMQVETPSARAFLTFESTPADGSAFEPGRLGVFAGAGAHVWASAVNGPGYTLRAVSPGTVFARVAAAKAATGAFEVAVGLAGDVNGDHQVDAQDLDAIRAARGARVGRPRYVPAADVNHNGIIGPGDLRLARRNLGVSVQVGPLTADPFLFAGSDALGLTRDARGATAVRPGLSLVIPSVLNGAPIPLDSFSWGVTNTTVVGGGGGGAGRATAGDFSFTMKTNQASPQILDAAFKGTHIPLVTLYVGRRAGTAVYPLLRWDLADVLVSSYHTGGSGVSTLEDSVSLNFARIHVNYYPVLPNGRPGDPVGSGWDFATAKSWGGPGG
jgi:type VI secretion system secreted protein Hcp